jgi:hypothetical protein
MAAKIRIMRERKLHNDPDADRLWKQCRHDADLRWVLEGILTGRSPELGRILLLSPVEVFGEAHARMGRKLSLLFRLTGFPYLSGTMKNLSQSLTRMMSGGRGESRQSGTARKAIADWAAANGRQAQDRIVAAVLETVRRNAPMRELANAEQPIDPILVARTLPDYGALDWTATEDLLRLFEPFLARNPSKKQINRFTLNFAALLPYFEPELTQRDFVLRSAVHFVDLLGKRGASETAWRDLLLKLIDRGLVAPSTSMFLWCRKYPEDGFVASAPFAFGALPPFCPSCGRTAHAIASFLPARGLRDAMSLKDGLLGAAVGWHLTRQRVRFWHAHCVKGTEMDFIAILSDGHLLIECKMFGVAMPMKQLARNVRDALEQLDDHAGILQAEGWKIRGSACVVNLTDRDLTSLRRGGFLASTSTERLISYERFRGWLRTESKR